MGGNSGKKAKHHHAVEGGLGERRELSGDPGPGESEAITLRMSRSGQWMDAAELREWAMEQGIARLTADSAAGPLPRLVLDVKGLDHLDARALQVVLAMRAAERSRGIEPELEHVSESLRQWLAYAGAEELAGGGARAKKPAGAEESRACAKF